MFVNRSSRAAAVRALLAPSLLALLASAGAGAAGTPTASLGPQPGSDGRCGTERNTWAFLDHPRRRLVHREVGGHSFQGWCNPGGGVTTRSYVTPGWAGDAIVNTGTPGANYWIDWRNTGAREGGHAEFDISMSRDRWQSGGQGYGSVTIGAALDSGRDLALTARGRWVRSRFTGSAEPVGKSHVQTIIWLTREAGAANNAGRDARGVCVDRQSIDITVVEWMPAALREDYRTLTYVNPVTRRVRSFESGGVSYQIYAREPGDICENASYLAVRDENGFESGSAPSVVDAGAIIRALLETGAPFDRSWHIALFGWEITGASADQSDVRLTDSGGKFVFACYSIPSLVGARGGPGYDRCDSAAGTTDVSPPGGSDGSSGGGAPAPAAPVPPATPATGLGARSASAALGAPAGLVATVYSASSAELFWTRPATPGLRYEIRRDGAVLTTTDGVSHYEGSLTSGRTYAYEIVAIGRDGERSNASRISVDTGGEVIVSPPVEVAAVAPSAARDSSAAGTTTLAAPSGLRGTIYSARNGEIFWTRPATPGLRYEVSRDGTVVTITDGVSHYDDTRIAGRTYRYDVVAIDAAGRRSAAADLTL